MTTRARAKGNRLELDALAKLQAVDGRDPTYANLETARGRLGPLYHLQVDGVTRRLAVECKNREDISVRLWDWLDGMKAAGKVRVLVVKRNRRRPLAVIDLDDLCAFLAAARDTTTAHHVDI